MTWIGDVIEGILDSDVKLGCAGILIVLAFLAVPTYGEIMQAKVERRCLRAGHPRGDFRWIGPDYCIKRVDQTDVVIPLSEVPQ